MGDVTGFAVFFFPQALEALGEAIKPYLEEGPAGPHILCSEIDTGGALIEMTIEARDLDGKTVELQLMVPVSMVRMIVSTRGEAAFASALAVLREGELLAIFPEGGITRDGQLQPFKGGVLKILEMAASEGVRPAVIPMGLSNLWGSYFSRVEVRNGEAVAMVRPFRRGFFSRVGLRVGEPLAASDVTLEVLSNRVAGLVD